MKRIRPETNDKNSSFLVIDSDQNNSTFAITNGAYGKVWAKKYKGNEKALPSLNEIVEGIICWHVL